MIFLFDIKGNPSILSRFSRNNNNTLIFKRSFHTTNSLKIDLPSIVQSLTPFFDVYHMLDLANLMSSTIELIEKGNPADGAARKLVSFLTSENPSGVIVAEACKINVENLQNVLNDPLATPTQKALALDQLSALKNQYLETVDKLDAFCTKYRTYYTGKPDINTIEALKSGGSPDSVTVLAKKLAKNFKT